MNKKVIYIFLLTTPLSGARWLRRDQLLEACGSVFESAREMSEFCKERTEQLHHCFSRKKNVGYNKLWQSNTDSGWILSGANRGQGVFHFSCPSHQTHRGKPLEQIIAFKKKKTTTLHKSGIHISTPPGWKGIIHHDTASGQRPSFVNSWLSSLMHYVDIIQ